MSHIQGEKGKQDFGEQINSILINEEAQTVDSSHPFRVKSYLSFSKGQSNIEKHRDSHIVFTNLDSISSINIQKLKNEESRVSFSRLHQSNQAVGP